jgi:hypothetical protein
MDPIGSDVFRQLDRNYDNKLDASELAPAVQDRLRRPGTNGPLVVDDLVFAFDKLEPSTTSRQKLAARDAVEKAEQDKNAADVRKLDYSPVSAGEYAGWFFLGFILGVFPLLFIMPWLQHRQERYEAHKDEYQRASQAAAAADVTLHRAVENFANIE